MEELILESINGNDEAYTKLTQSIQNELYRVAQARLDNIDDINDAIQETMIIAYKSLKSLENTKYFKTWIIKILINECNKIYARYKWEDNIFSKLIKDKNCVIGDNLDMSNIEDKLDIESMLSKLKYEERIAIVLFYNSNYSLNEISEILDTSPNTIKSRITRGKEKIKKYYRGGVENETAER